MSPRPPVPTFMLGSLNNELISREKRQGSCKSLNFLESAGI